MGESFAVAYSIIPVNPQAHLFEIQCRIEKPATDGQVVSLPAWIPGSYMIRDFARNIVSIAGSDNNGPVALSKLDKQTWKCAPCSGVLILTYQVYAWDLSVRSAHLDQTHAYFNGTSVFLRVHGQDEIACVVTLQRPVGEEYKAWRVATSLPRLAASEYAFGTYQAKDYDELVDHPVEMGTFTLASFNACGVKHDVAITGIHDADMDRLCADLKRICEQHIKFMGEPAPMDYYLFQVMAVGEGYGGLEHRASTSLVCSRYDLPSKQDPKISDAYLTFLGLCSHEYFHTWNVKRIKPAMFMPYDLSKETPTKLLWWFEGITSYYDDLGLVRSGVIDQGSYLELLGQMVTRVIRGKGRFKQTVTESSFDAWSKFYKQDESAPNHIVSYYTKGSLIALALDLTIRQQTGHRKSLDDVMQHLWKAYGQTQRGIGEDELEAVISQVAGVDLSDFLQRALNGVEDMPLAELFKDIGVDYRLRKALSQNDQGGKPAKDAEKINAYDIGIRYAVSNGTLSITHVLDDTAAQKAGLSAGDSLLAINGIKATADSLDKLLSRASVGDVLQLHVFRRDELMQMQLDIIEPEKTTCYLELSKDESFTELRTKWLSN